MNRTLIGIGGIAAASLSFAAWHQLEPMIVGPISGGTAIVPTGQKVRADDHTITFNARPFDVAISSSSQYAYLKTNAGIVVVDIKSMSAFPPVKIEGGSPFCGIVLSPDDRTLCYTSVNSGLLVFDVDKEKLNLRKSIPMPAARVGGASAATGLTFQDASHVLVCLNRDNSLAQVDLDSGGIQKWDTDVAPFSVAFDQRTRRAFVTCWSRPAKPGEPQATSAGTSVPVDERGVGLGGRLTILDLRQGSTVASLPIGHHAGEIDTFEDSLYIPCSGSDTIDSYSLTSQVHQSRQLFAKHPRGAAPSSCAFSPDGKRVYIACSGRNSVLVMDRIGGRTLGEIPTAWYPVAVRWVKDKLVVACTKGIGERAPEKNAASHNSWDLTGSLCVLDPFSGIRPVEQTPRLSAQKSKPAPVPAVPGQPSVFKHVVYIIRENRTYDQLFGDMKEGDGDPTLCNFGERITPNAHALAREYALLDNYYCNGICSADGHSWATEGNTTANLERSTSAWQRSYPFGDDALNTSSTGFLWDAILAKGKSFLNFGEFDYASTAKGETYFACLKEHQAGKQTIGFKQNIGVERVRKHSVKGFPGWDLSIPDVVRADIFRKHLSEMEAKGSMPDFIVLYLCCDHTGGPVTARAQVADNDLATGLCVEALTKSRFWKDTCIFVEEDDPQAGWDHVDGHRSPCLVISPYSRGRGRVSHFYNQTSVARTIEDIFGIAPTSYFVSISPLMSACFGPTADTTAYQARPSQIALDETKVVSSRYRFNVTKPDIADEKAMNRAIWAETMPGRSYPSSFEGAHGKGLARRGLISLVHREDD